MTTQCAVPSNSVALGAVASEWMQQMPPALHMHKGEPNLGLPLAHSQGAGHLDSPAVGEGSAEEHI